MIDSRALRCGDGTNNRFAAPIFRHEPTFLELFLHPIDICSRKIDLVERDHDLYMRSGLGVIDRFNRLGHEAIVGCDDEHNNVGHIGAPGAHGGEGGVARSVDESDFRSLVIDAVGPDMLRDPTSFPRCHARLANGVHQRGLAVIDMPHERDDRGARLEFLFLFNNRRRRRDDHLFDFVNSGSFFTALFFENKPVVFRDLGRNIGFDCLIDVGENVVGHQLCDELMRLQTELACQLLNDDWWFDQYDFLRLCFLLSKGRRGWRSCAIDDCARRFSRRRRRGLGLYWCRRFWRNDRLI